MVYVNLTNKRIKDVSSSSVGIITRVENVGHIGVEWFSGKLRGEFSRLNISDVISGEQYELEGAK